MATPRPLRTRPLSWHQLTKAYAELAVAVDQVLLMERIPSQARTVLTDAKVTVEATKRGLRREPPARRP